MGFEGNDLVCSFGFRYRLKTFFFPLSILPGKLGGQDSFESTESYESCDRLTQSWSSQSSFNSLQRVPSYDSFDSEDYPTALHGHKPKGTFKDYVRERSDLSKDKPVIPAAALAGYTGQFLSPCALTLSDSDVSQSPNNNATSLITL